jgi:hypothetical protein
MITAVKASLYLYRLLNVSTLLTAITGKVYRVYKPKTSELEDVVINILFLDSGYYTDIQNGEANINIFVKNIDGVPNITRLDTISGIILTLLETNKQSNNLFSYEILQTKLFSDSEQNTMTFLNIKLQIHKY